MFANSYKSHTWLFEQNTDIILPAKVFFFC